MRLAVAAIARYSNKCHNLPAFNSFGTWRLDGNDASRNDDSGRTSNSNISLYSVSVYNLSRLDHLNTIAAESLRPHSNTCRSLLPTNGSVFRSNRFDTSAVIICTVALHHDSNEIHEYDWHTTRRGRNRNVTVMSFVYSFQLKVGHQSFVMFLKRLSQ